MKDKMLLKITDYIESDLDWEHEQCKRLGIDLVTYQMKDSGPGALIAACNDADILIMNMANMSAEAIAGMENAKVIIRHGIGYENLDVTAATEAGIVCANEPKASSEDVAEQAIMLMLAVYRKLQTQTKLFDLLIEEGKNLKGQMMMETIHPVFRMGGKTLGIIGCGNIGRYVLQKMRGFGMNILVCDPYMTPGRKKELGIEHTPLEELLKASDIVTVHVPVTNETTGLINQTTLKLMKPSAILINTARAKIINTPELGDALRNGIIAGAGIDVHYMEPPPDDYELLGLDNVILTPHLAWYSEEGGWDIRHMIMNDVTAILAGGLPENVLNPEVVDRANCRLKFSQ